MTGISFCLHEVCQELGKVQAGHCRGTLATFDHQMMHPGVCISEYRRLRKKKKKTVELVCTRVRTRNLIALVYMFGIPQLDTLLKFAVSNTHTHCLFRK